MKYRALMPKVWNKMLGDVLNTQYNPHNCRHTFITAMTRAGVEKQILRKIVGHAAEDITDHYTHVSTEELLEAINKLEY